ncbi:biliverdin-producing heme oxygenase [Erythrobacter insulae]|uniref:Biliverdin-producing heme oxygenase n=1 Tax=Erythrobacter insulae TaxID=2584124 RepID=A0A547P9Z4_9SPHN|nr:biliverdin-producing heme oxygenase [Erythrobacter insulae]TRD10972.1 biliverdin-producing heme oxygenase [Erythrobacter insulae]
MRSASGWTSTAAYGRFLALQYAARIPVETWLRENAPSDLRPPEQSQLIARDLATLNMPRPSVSSPFTLDVLPNDNASALGAAWVLAGSSLGNRAILKDLERNGRRHWPSAFLGDPGMLAFWKQLRPHIEMPASLKTLASATGAAIAVFDHFIANTSESGDLAQTCPAALV